MSTCSFTEGTETPHSTSPIRRLTINFDMVLEHPIESLLEQLSNLFRTHPISSVNIKGKDKTKLLPILKQLACYTLITNVSYSGNEISSEIASALAQLQTSSLVIHSPFEDLAAVNSFTSTLKENYRIGILTIHLSQDELLNTLCDGLGNGHLSELTLLSTQDDFRPQLSWDACADLSNNTNMHTFTTNMSIGPYFAHEPAARLNSYSTGLLRNGIKAMFMPNVIKFNFAGAHLGTDNATDLIHMFWSDKYHVHSLTLDNNDIQLLYTSTYRPSFIQGLLLMIESGECHFLSLANNSLSNDIALVLQCNQLESINLSNTYMTNIGAALIARYIQNNTSLQSLDISCNRFSYEGIILLARALSVNSTLRYLNIGDIPMDTTSICAIFNALHSNRSIEYLVLDNVGINSKVAESMFELIAARQDAHLQLRISLKGCSIGKLTMVMLDRYSQLLGTPVRFIIDDSPDTSHQPI